MAKTAKEIRQERAWKTRYLALFNVYYWQETMAHVRRIRNAVRWVGALIGLVATASMLLVGKEWYAVTAIACTTFVTAVLAPLIERHEFKDAKMAYERWSNLWHDADGLWDEGRACDWCKKSLEQAIERLDAAAKYNHTYEYVSRNDARSDYCQDKVNRELLHGHNDV